MYSNNSSDSRTTITLNTPTDNAKMLIQNILNNATKLNENDEEQLYIIKTHYYPKYIERMPPGINHVLLYVTNNSIKKISIVGGLEETPHIYHVYDNLVCGHCSNIVKNKDKRLCFLYKKNEVKYAKICLVITNIVKESYANVYFFPSKEFPLELKSYIMHKPENVILNYVLSF